jgi:hypothetical protein
MKEKTVQKSPALTRKKEALYQKSSEYKSAMTSDINKLKFDIARIGKNFLIIGGSLYAAYKLSKLFTGSREEEPPPPPRVVQTREPSPMMAKAKEQIALFLLALSFKKLKDFIEENRKDKNGQEGS